MRKRIHILGASGSGTSTLGHALTKWLPHVNFDGDDYYWIEKFNLQREPSERLRMLARDLSHHDQWILSGAVCGWGNDLIHSFDLVIFLYVPSEIRLQRLMKRETERYGDDILPGGCKYEQSKAFIDWASLYEEGGLDIRSKALHDQWMSDLSCPVIRIEGDHSVEERVDIILEYIKNS